MGKGNKAYPEYVGDKSLVKQNPNELGKNANKETDPLCEMLKLALFLFLIFLTRKENLPLSDPEATECCFDPNSKV